MAAQPPTTCLRCQGPMEPGFLDDADQTRTRWVRGPLVFGLLGNARKLGREKLEIVAFRCRACGTLELLALDTRQVGLVQAMAARLHPAPPADGPAPPSPVGTVGTVDRPPISPSAWPQDGGR